MKLPAQVVNMLINMLAQLADGQPVTFVPLHTELSTQEAADLLGVSRPFLVKELQSGKLAFRRIGTHRRIILKDLLAYKATMQQERSKALDQLVEQAQELNMGYS